MVMVVEEVFKFVGNTQNMKKILSALFLTTLLLGPVFRSKAQCNWEAQINDGFEYSTAIIGILPGTTVHTTPQTFAVHSGSSAAYLNFLNCNGGAGTCAGTKVFERVMGFCPDVPVRMNIWFATSFSGVQCDIKIVISDENGNVVDSVASLLPGYSPSWTNYISNTLNLSTDTIIFSIYTNIDGSPSGNDLAIDDYKLEQCVITHTSTVAGICNNLASTDLFSKIPSSPVSSGTWAGPSTLTNGYLGTFTYGVNTGGQYIYSSSPYGTAQYCPSRKDTVIAFPATAPVVNIGNDTTLCTNQNIILTTGTSGSNTYNWSTGATIPVLAVPAPGGAGGTVNYSVIVTNSLGCSDEDTIAINYIVCSGLSDLEKLGIQLYPNPASDYLQIRLNDQLMETYEVVLTDVTGKIVLRSLLEARESTLDLSSIRAGMYQVLLMTEGRRVGSGQLVITD